MSTHTPGSWRPGQMVMTKAQWAELRGRDAMEIVQRGSDVIAVVWCGDDNDGEEEANARLIAAAPELLEALQGVFVLEDRLLDDIFGYEWLNQAKAAIAKASDPKGGK